MKLLIMLFSPLICYIIPLRPKYFPQHPVLKHPQSFKEENFSSVAPSRRMGEQRRSFSRSQHLHEMEGGGQFHPLAAFSPGI